MEARAESDTERWIRFEFARHVHAYLQDQIRFADTKAGLTAAVAGVLFGAFRDATRSSIAAFPPRTIGATFALVFGVLFALLSLAAILNAYRVISPRLPAGVRVGPHHRILERITEAFDRETRGYRLTGLVNWAEISEHVTRPGAYGDAVSAKGADDLTRQLAEDSVALAVIAGQKYQHVRLALNSLFLAAISLILLMVSLGMGP